MLEVRPLEIEELALVSARLPLNRLEHPDGEYLVAWSDSNPVGHARLDWSSDPPELQDVFVAESLRGRGVGSALCLAAERRVANRDGGIALEVRKEDLGVQRFYEKLGYRRTSDPPRRVIGTIELRHGSTEVDETLLRFEKSLRGYAGAPGSSSSSGRR